ncbi:MAG: B12-binding domain-containing radical SAM protein [Acidobacteria bacterium]|nr:B12-binding domain-containing radical SAM protein [Acidobacteriota bacterium]
MKILLYCPDNGVTRNFMPNLWMFLLQALTPPEHQVILIDGNARAMNETELAAFVTENDIGLVGIGAMTRMIAKAYRMADVIRATGVPVVMGGPHVTELPDEALGRNGEPRHADAVALGEADETWPQIIEDVLKGNLRDIYEKTNGNGGRHKPSLETYPVIPWDTLDLDQFNLVPPSLQLLFRRMGADWARFYMIPVESGRGCPYGCEFCTVTGFFGDSVRFRTNESVVEELLRLKRRMKNDGGQIAVFFIDDNFAIHPQRAKQLLRDMIAADACLPWVGQISANLLRDEELIDLIAQSGGKWIFIGMESIDATNLATVKKGFNKPDEYGAMLDRLARRHIYAITSFIFGMDNDTPGVAGRTLEQIETWAPGLPVFGQLTPYPATPLWDRLLKSGRLVRPRHWLEFAPFEMAHTPAKMTVAQVREEIKEAWLASYSPRQNARAIRAIRHHPVSDRIIHLICRFFFRGIYFPQMSRWAWLKVLARNSRTIFSLSREGIAELRAFRKKAKIQSREKLSLRPSHRHSDQTRTPELSGPSAKAADGSFSKAR